MIRRGVKIQLVAFVVISLVGIVYVGAQLRRLQRHQPPLHREAHARRQRRHLPQRRGHRARRRPSAGSASMRAQPDSHQVEVTLNIKHGTKIPADGIKATVANLSAVGEQYVDLEPTTTGEPYLSRAASSRRPRPPCPSTTRRCCSTSTSSSTASTSST